MKTLLGFFAVLFAANMSHAYSAEQCVAAAEQAAWEKWYDPSAWSMGNIQAGGTDVVWIRDGVISYQVSILHKKPDSQTLNSANYSVRVRASDCSVIKVRKF